MKRAFKDRFCPNDARAAELSRTSGCVRKVHDMTLVARTEAWVPCQERVDCSTTSAMPTAWKRTGGPARLHDVSSVPLQQAPRHLQRAFTHLLVKRAKNPRFTSRKKSRKPAEPLGSKALPDAGKAVGADAGPGRLLTLSTGEKTTGPRHERRDRAHLARAQRELSRKARAPATGPGPVGARHASTPGSPTDAVTSSTNRRHVSSVRTERS